MTTSREGRDVKASHRWSRSAGLVLVVLGLAAPAARATDITNPAQHPAPIDVTIDGQVYRDGADTLPGYDDYACTPIPNVQYDFADDEIQYYDGDGNLITTAHWTEWDRISSYQTWAAQQHAGTPSNTTTTGSGTSTPAPTSTTTTSAGTSAPAATSQAGAGTGTAAPAATSQAGAGATTKTTNSVAKTKGATTKTTSAATSPATKTTSATRKTTRSAAAHGTTTTTAGTPKEATSSHAKKGGTSTASIVKHGTANRHAATAAPTTAADTSAGATSAAPAAAAGAASTARGTAAPAATPGAGGAPKYKLVSDTGAGGVGDTRPVGVGILVAIFALAGVVFLFGSAKRRAFSRRTQHL
jgi:hypothetical protein